MATPLDQLLADYGLNFTLQIPGHSFRVHKDIMAAASDFDTSCSFVDIASKISRPLAVLRLVQVIYTGGYVDREADLSQPWKDYLARSTIVPVEDRRKGSFGFQEANILFFSTNTVP